MTIAAAACTDAPVAPRTRAPDPAPRPSAALESPRESPYGCYISEAVVSPHYRYRYIRRALHFPSPALAPDGSTLEYRLRLQEPGKDPAMVANCVIPRTRTAVRLLEQWLQVPRDVRYTLTHASGRTESTIRTVEEGGEPCDSQLGDKYDETSTCFTLVGITATGVPSTQGGWSEPPPPAPPPGEPGGTESPGGGSAPCDNCQYDISATFGCTSSVQRGGTVTCAISAARREEASVAVYAWVFLDAEGRMVQTQEAFTRWSGTAVAGGTVTVRFADGTGVREVTSRFTVTDRGWTWSTHAVSQYSDGTGVQCAHWGTPDTGGSNGINLPMGAPDCGFAQRSIQPDSYAPAGDGFTVKTVAGGPNQGFHYIESARLYLRRESSYNRHLWSDAPQVPLNDARQQSACGPLANWYQFTLCMGDDPEAYITGTRNHEGYGSTGHNGHFSAAYDAVAAPANDPMIFFDQLVGGNDIDFGAFFQDVRDQFYARAGKADIATLDRSNGGTIVGGNYSGRYWGYWAPEGRFIPTTRDD